MICADRWQSSLLRGRAEMDQCYATLGHESVTMTQQYMGENMQTRKGRAGVDRSGLKAPEFGATGASLFDKSD